MIDAKIARQTLLFILTRAVKVATTTVKVTVKPTIFYLEHAFVKACSLGVLTLRRADLISSLLVGNGRCAG
jgi:hypothetical protein